MAPSPSVHCTLPLGSEDFHLEKSLPSNNTIASEGAVDTALLTIASEGVTILGTGFHSSEDSGVCFVGSTCAMPAALKNKITADKKPRLSILITILSVKK